jgi:ATP-dependent Clp protease ATP-binding subunit ClpA
MFERFTQAARDIVIQAQSEARDLRHPFVGTEHLLLAMISNGDDPIPAALRDSGADPAALRQAIIARVGSSPASAEPLPDPDADDAAALKSIGIDLDAVRRAIEDTFGPGALCLPRPVGPKRRGVLRRFSGGGHVFSGGGHVPFSRRAKKVLELSLREAIRLKHTFIAPEHLMLGILREGQGLAALVLADAGTDVAKLRDDLTRSLHDRAA